VRLRAPLDGYIYEAVGDGTVRVTTPKGQTGLYTRKAQWLEGDIGDVSLHMCDWVGGPMVAPTSSWRGRGMDRDAARAALKGVIPSIAEKIADIEFNAIYFTLFPNFHPWGSFNQIVYRFRPNGDNHEECIMEVMHMSPAPEGSDRPPPAKVTELGFDDDWTLAPEIGMIAKTFNQDSANMEHVHRGMRATKKTHIRLGEYGETKIRHFHKLLEAWVARP